MAMGEGSASRWHQALIGIGALVVGGLLAWGARSIPGEAGYAGVGPNFLPWAVALALLACGALLLAGALRGGWQGVEEPAGAARGDWPSLAWVAAGIVANAALLTTIGFVLACTLCYMLAVRGLRRSEGKAQGGARGCMLDFATGFLIAGSAYWIFTKLLAINLPGITGTGWL